MIRTVFPAGAEMPSPHARGYFKMPDGKVVDATDWNPSWGWASGNMISTLEDMRVWARDFAMGKLLSPAMKRERARFLPAPRKATARYTVWRSKTRTAGSDTMATS